jgi:hypothetical protein
MLVDMPLVLLVLVHNVFLMVFLLVLLLRPRRIIAFFAYGSTWFSSRVAPLRHDSESAQNHFHSNWHLHHANPLNKLSASLTCVTKYWIPKYVLANHLGSKSRSSLSPCV